MLTTTDISSIHGASSPKTETVRLWPYAPGVYGRDALYRVWRAMEEDGATKQALWDEVGETGADLVSFVKAFADPSRLLLMIERLDTGALCGCFWVTQMSPGHQAFVGMWMQHAARGPLSVEAARLALAHTFEYGQFRQLWAVTPWRAAAALCRRMGFLHTATLEAFCIWDGQPKDVLVLRLTKEAFDGFDIQKR